MKIENEKYKDIILEFQNLLEDRELQFNEQFLLMKKYHDLEVYTLKLKLKKRRQQYRALSQSINEFLQTENKKSKKKPIMSKSLPPSLMPHLQVEEKTVALPNNIEVPQIKDKLMKPEFQKKMVKQIKSADLVSFVYIPWEDENEKVWTSNSSLLLPNRNIPKNKSKRHSSHSSILNSPNLFIA